MRWFSKSFRKNHQKDNTKWNIKFSRARAWQTLGVRLGYFSVKVHLGAKDLIELANIEQNHGEWLQKWENRYSLDEFLRYFRLFSVNNNRTAEKSEPYLPSPFVKLAPTIYNPISRIKDLLIQAMKYHMLPVQRAAMQRFGTLPRHKPDQVRTTSPQVGSKRKYPHMRLGQILPSITYIMSHPPWQLIMWLNL